MTCNPTQEKMKAIAALGAGIVGTALVVFTGMGIHYRNEVAKVEHRYESVFIRMDEQLAVEKEANRKDLQLILDRLSRMESKVGEAQPSKED